MGRMPLKITVSTVIAYVYA